MLFGVFFLNMIESYNFHSIILICLHIHHFIDNPKSSFPKLVDDLVFASENKGIHIQIIMKQENGSRQ